MNSLHLPSMLEALLFVAGEPMTYTKLAHITGYDKADIRIALDTLEERLRTRGIRVLRTEGELVTLVTAPQFSSHIEQLVKEEFFGDLSKAALDTLTIIAYYHPITRHEVEYIRGVNSSFMLRNLLVRGLIERASSRDGQAYRYQPTLEFMQFLGITSLHNLPQYDALREVIKSGIETGRTEDA